jgi:hypothetical protein
MFMFLFLVVGSIVVNLDVTLEQLYVGHFLEVFSLKVGRSLSLLVCMRLYLYLCICLSASHAYTSDPLSRFNELSLLHKRRPGHASVTVALRCRRRSLGQEESRYVLTLLRS